MRRVLIITPYFPPINAPDMQRVRMSLPYFRQYGWEPTVMTVDEQYANGFRDELLLETIPTDIEVIKVGAYPEHRTRKLGLGSLSLRSLPHFRKAGDELLKSGKYDLVFFSTSMHHVMSLGKRWKKKFGVPFIVDMQDPWRNDFRIGKAKQVSALKFWIAYSINKYMEAYTMPAVDGIITVSQAYIDVLKERYPSIKNVPAKVITFGASTIDFDLVTRRQLSPAVVDTHNGKINVLYMGAVTPFFIPLIRLFFEALLEHKEPLNKYHFYFIGTSYVQNSRTTMVADLAKELGIGDYVTEVPDRTPYLNALATLRAADILFIPGSIDKGYNASKVYNNILSGTPIFSIFHENSTVIPAIQQAGAGVVHSFRNMDDPAGMKKDIYKKWTALVQNRDKYPTATGEYDFTAEKKTAEICAFFEDVLTTKKHI